MRVLFQESILVIKLRPKNGIEEKPQKTFLHLPSRERYKRWEGALALTSDGKKGKKGRYRRLRMYR